jgi:hypothetical protein
VVTGACGGNTLPAWPKNAAAGGAIVPADMADSGAGV